MFRSGRVPGGDTMTGMFVDQHPDVLDRLPAGYRDLFGRLLDVVRDDDRVVQVWLAGSVGRGTADAGSDLDVVLSVVDNDFDAFAADWRTWLARVTPTVLARGLSSLPGSWYSLTPDCERFDAVVERYDHAPVDQLAHRSLVFDRTAPATGPARSADGGSDPELNAGRGPDPERLAGLVEECLRQQANFPASVVAREDWLLGVVGVHQVHLMLYQLFVESNQPLPRLGVKQWSAKLTAEQRNCLLRLRVPPAEREPLIDAMRDSAAVFRTEAAAILAACQVPWPEELDAAVRTYFARTLG